MAKICDLRARQVFDSRGTPTVEAEVTLSDGGVGRFITPSGASCGKKEAVELRDNDPDRYFGKGVELALDNIRSEVSQAVMGQEFACQSELDRCLIELDGGLNKARLGANAILAVSGAFFHALADSRGMPLYNSGKSSEPLLLPLPLVNVINGGVHANNHLDIQEFMLVPSGATSFSHAMRMVAEVFSALKTILRKSGFSTAVGDEGGFAPDLSSDEHALKLLQEAVVHAGYRPGLDLKFALDVAASELFDEGAQSYRINGQNFSRHQLLDWYEDVVSRFAICSIEDPFHEDDIEGFTNMVKKLGQQVQIVGDDLFATNPRYIKQGLKDNSATAVLIKMNQIGTISETLHAVELSKGGGFNTIISHRSGDSEDTTIADLAVLTGAGQIKTGSICRSERVAKYNRLLRIEEELGEAATFCQMFK